MVLQKGFIENSCILTKQTYSVHYITDRNAPQIVKCRSLNSYITFALFDPDMGNSIKPNIGPEKTFQNKLLGNRLNGMHQPNNVSSINRISTKTHVTSNFQMR